MNHKITFILILLSLLALSLTQTTDCNSGISSNDKIQTGNSYIHLGKVTAVAASSSTSSRQINFPVQVTNFPVPATGFKATACTT